MILVFTFRTRIILTIEAIQIILQLTLQHTTKQFNIPQSILSDKITRKASKVNKMSNKPTLMLVEEKTIVRYIFNLDL